MICLIIRTDRIIIIQQNQQNIMTGSPNQHWHDLLTNKLYKIDKETGLKREIDRNNKIKLTYDTQLSGRASYKFRIENSKQENHPQLPSFFKRQNKMLQKYQSKQKLDKHSQQIILIPNERRKSIDSSQPSLAAPLLTDVRYSLSDHIQQVISKERFSKKNQFLKKNSVQTIDTTLQNYSHHKNDSQANDIFKLTRYYSNQKKNNLYRFSNNPQDISEYPKPIPLNYHQTINSILLKKKQTIEDLEKKLLTSQKNQKKIIKLKTQHKDQAIMSQIQRTLQQKIVGTTKNPKIIASQQYLPSPEKQRRLTQRKQKLLMQKVMLKMQQSKELRKFKNLLQK